MKTLCDKDCLNCKFTKCAYDIKEENYKLSKKEHDKIYYRKNRERIIKKSSEYNKQHEEKIKEYRKQYYQNNKEKLTKMNKYNYNLKKKQGSK